MIKSLRMLGEDLRQKAQMHFGSDGTAAVIKVLAVDGTPSMVLYRLMQGSRDAGLGPLAMVFNKMNSIFCNCIIGRGADFGPGFVLFHATGVVINGQVKGGANVHLQHEVTIGDDGIGSLSPQLGSNIRIGAGAKVIGPITIGDGARIGANAVVVKNVDADTTVVGIPARPVKRREKAEPGATPPPPQDDHPPDELGERRNKLGV